MAVLLSFQRPALSTLLLMAAAATLFSVGWADEGTSKSPAAPQTPKADALSKDEQALIDRTNDERRKLKLPPVSAQPLLTAMAREHSSNMARLDMLSHELEGKSFPKRLEASGYRSQSAGENVAAGQATPAAAIDSWMNSPGHRANLLNPDYVHIGVGLKMSAKGQIYYTQVFGRPFPASP